MQRKKQQHISRCKDAVTIRISNSLNAIVNGVYRPLWLVCNDWPVYAKVNDPQLKIKYDDTNKNWTIRRPQGILAALKCEAPCFPELRYEGANGIVEFVRLEDGRAEEKVENKTLLIQTEATIVAEAAIHWPNPLGTIGKLCF